jgi:PAS domain S-box-containing protein
MFGDPAKESVEASASPDASENPVDRLVEIISRSQQNYRELIDNLDQAVFTLSLDGEIRVANRRLSEILGTPFAELIGRSFSDFVETPTLADAREALRLLSASGSWQGTVPIRFKPENRLRYFRCWFQAMAENGEVTGVTGWARDATAEHESEIRFGELFESLREGMFFTTPDGRLLDANPALVRMLGCGSKEELQARNFREFYNDPLVRDALVREIEEKGSVEDREIVLRHASGKNIHCLASGFAIRDASGRMVTIQGTLIDISERLEMERRLRQEQEFIRRLIANFPDVIAVLDRNGKYTYVSHRVQDMLGNPPQVFIGEQMDRWSHPDDKPKLWEMFRKLLEGEQSQIQFEFRAQHRDGSWRTLKASAGPLYHDGRINGIVASARDVTDAKRIEQQFAQSEKFAAMGQMLVGAAHELNNPLTAILGVGDLMRERATEDTTRRHAEVVLRQARRAAEIVQNLLAFSRPRQASADVHVDQLIQDVLKREQDSLRAKNITVRLNVPQSLPSVEGDPKFLTQAFLNIVTNAKQAISAVRDKGILDVSASASGSRVLVAFSDDGAGISAEDMPKIFDPFFTTKRPGGGSGLGLTISLAVVKEHGGTIEVESQQGGGAIFKVSLPIAAHASMSADDSSARRAWSGLEALKGRSVLVVDDEDGIREIVQEGLSARGLKVDCAESSEAALELLAGHTYDFVLCDFNLPGMPGSDLFEHVRQRPSSPVFVFMTGDLLDSTQIAEFRQKEAHFLQKPFHLAALASLLVELSQPAGTSR